VPAHYTTIVDFVDHWQTLLTGLIALIAAMRFSIVAARRAGQQHSRQIVLCLLPHRSPG
jgi:hypothetical protein